MTHNEGAILGAFRCSACEASLNDEAKAAAIAVGVDDNSQNDLMPTWASSIIAPRFEMLGELHGQVPTFLINHRDSAINVMLVEYGIGSVVTFLLPCFAVLGLLGLADKPRRLGSARSVKRSVGSRKRQDRG